jgi:hypothetical protein
MYRYMMTVNNDVILTCHHQNHLDFHDMGFTNEEIFCIVKNDRILRLFLFIKGDIEDSCIITIIQMSFFKNF